MQVLVTVYRAPFADGSSVNPIFSVIATVAVPITIPIIGLLTTIVGANSSNIAIPINQGDLIAVTVSVNSIISATVGSVAFSAGLSVA